MKPALFAVVAILAISLAAVFYLQDSRPEFGDIIEPDGPRVCVDAEGQPVLDVARRVVAPGEAGPDTSVRYRLIDIASNRPIDGARIHRARDGGVLAKTDADGFADVPGGAVNTLVFGADRYLSEHYFDRPELVRSLAGSLKHRGHIRILLEPDDLTVPCVLRFLRVDGEPAAGVEFRIECVDEPKPAAMAVPSSRLRDGAAVGEELQAAWRRHVLLSTIVNPDLNPELLHFGRQSESVTFRCSGEVELRFVAAGVYRVHARAGSEFRRQTFEVSIAERRVVTIQLREGQVFRGQVIDGKNKDPIVGALVVLSRADAIVTSGESDIDGRFELGPVLTAAMKLEIGHPAYERLVIERVRPGNDRVHHLVPMAKNRVRGVVRRRPELTAIVDAEVRLSDGTGVVVKGRTDREGRFDLQSHLIEPALEIEAEGYLEYVEMLNANGESRRFDLIPNTPERRMRAGLSALIAGTVLDEKGEPAPNRPVHVRPQKPWTPRGIDGRRIVRGGILPFSQMVVTDSAGRFEVEWTRPEPIRLIAVKGVTRDDQGHRMTVVLGRRHRVVLREGR